MKSDDNSPYSKPLSLRQRHQYRHHKMATIANGHNRTKGRWGPYFRESPRPRTNFRSLPFSRSSRSLSSSPPSSRTHMGSVVSSVIGSVRKSSQSAQHSSFSPRKLAAGQLDLLLPMKQKFTLEIILKDQINWVPATKLTFDTEIGLRPEMAPLTRDQKKNKLTALQRDRLNTITGAGTRVSKEWPSFAKHKKPRGLNNPHQYCYRRSIMQALIHTPQILNWATTHNLDRKAAHQDCPHDDPCAGCHLKNVMMKYFKGTQAELNEAVNTFDRAFVNTLWPRVAATNFTEGNALRRNQQDAQEFLQFIGIALRRPSSKKLDLPGDKKKKAAVWDPDSDPDTRPMPKRLYDALFTVQTRARWVCPSCHAPHDSQQKDFGMYITTNKPAPHLSVQEYINQEFKGEVIDNVSCDKCGAKGLKAKRKTNIVGAPDVLFIGLRCFGYNRFTHAQQKLKSNLRLDSQIDLTAAQPEAESKHHELKYVLKHVVTHSGASPRSGHYYGKYTTPKGVWELNDSGTAGGARLGSVDGGLSTMPYVLVYSQV